GVTRLEVHPASGEVSARRNETISAATDGRRSCAPSVARISRKSTFRPVVHPRFSSSDRSRLRKSSTSARENTESTPMRRALTWLWAHGIVSAHRVSQQRKRAGPSPNQLIEREEIKSSYACPGIKRRYPSARSWPVSDRHLWGLVVGPAEVEVCRPITD